MTDIIALYSKINVMRSALSFYANAKNWEIKIDGIYNLGKIWIEDSSDDNFTGKIKTENGRVARECLELLDTRTGIIGEENLILDEFLIRIKDKKTLNIREISNLLMNIILKHHSREECAKMMGVSVRTIRNKIKRER